MCLAAVDFLVARPSLAAGAGELGRVSVHRTPYGGAPKPVPCQSAVPKGTPCGGHLTVETADSVVRLNTYEAGIHTIAAFLDSWYLLRFRGDEFTPAEAGASTSFTGMTGYVIPLSGQHLGLANKLGLDRRQASLDCRQAGTVKNGR